MKKVRNVCFGHSLTILETDEAKENEALQVRQRENRGGKARTPRTESVELKVPGWKHYVEVLMSGTASIDR
jgi:hypothetical protein